MPSKRANVKNEKQYEALKDKGMSKERGGEDRQLARRIEPWRQEVRLRRQLLAGRHNRPEEGSRPQGRQGHRSQELRNRSRGVHSAP